MRDTTSWVLRRPIFTRNRILLSRGGCVSLGPPLASELTSIGIAVVEHGRRYLVGTRGKGLPLAGFAEFPGGKCRIGESPDQCAVRECVEETGLAVACERVLLNRHFEYPHGWVDLHFVLCRPESSAAVTDQHQCFRWIAFDELMSLKFPEANGPLLRILALRAAETDLAVR